MAQIADVSDMDSLRILAGNVGTTEAREALAAYDAGTITAGELSGRLATAWRNALRSGAKRPARTTR